MEAIKMELPSELQNTINETVKEALDICIKNNVKANQFPPYMNQRLAASYLHVAPATIIKWEKQYSNFPVMVVDGVKRYKKTSLDNWMLSKTK